MLLGQPQRWLCLRNSIGHSTIQHKLTNMLGMTEPDNVVSLAEWKQCRMQAQGRVQAVPVYAPVRDLDGRWRLELTGTTTFDPEFHFYVDPS
jgi:hypothetical protein